MSRANMANRETAVHDFLEHFKFAMKISGMNMQYPNLSRNHAGKTNVSQKLNYLINCRER